MKSEIGFYMRRIGPVLLVAGAAVLVALSISYPFPGSWTESLATPEVPLRGFWIALAALIAAAVGFGLWLAGWGMEER